MSTVPDMVDMDREIERCEKLSGKQPKQITVTALAIPGAMCDAPMLDKRGRRRPERQLLIHPDDWEQFERTQLSVVGGHGQIIHVRGVPVVHDE
jgi:hypothetical protein